VNHSSSSSSSQSDASATAAPSIAPAVDRALQFDLIAFDWDGTLYDSTAIIVRCIQDAVRDVGGTVPGDEQAAYVIGMSLMQALAHAAPDVPIERHPQLRERYAHHYHRLQDDISLFPGALEMLRRLKARGHRLAVATGKSRAGLDRVLQAEELQGMFDASRTADETAGKPHPRMLHELMRQFGVAPRRLLMVGDTTHDLQMAINAGCPSVGVSYGAHAHGSFAALHPRCIAHSVDELEAWLRDFG
jgi:phosphoglycolate phosphatase